MKVGTTKIFSHGYESDDETEVDDINIALNGMEEISLSMGRWNEFLVSIARTEVCIVF